MSCFLLFYMLKIYWLKETVTCLYRTNIYKLKLKFFTKLKLCILPAAAGLLLFYFLPFLKVLYYILMHSYTFLNISIKFFSFFLYLYGCLNYNMPFIAKKSIFFSISSRIAFFLSFFAFRQHRISPRMPCQPRGARALPRAARQDKR